MKTGIVRALAVVELLLVFALCYAYFHITEFRIEWSWLLLLWIPLLAVRLWAARRLWPRSPMLPALVAFGVLGIINIYSAPMTRGWVMLTRAVMGMLIYLSFVEYVRAWGNLNGLLIATVVLGLIMGLLALTASQWLVTKSPVLAPIIDRLPVLNPKLFLPDAQLSFNPNEIGGGLAWMCPLLAGLALYRAAPRALRWSAGAAFLLVLAGLVLGQSRFALAGTLTALFLIALLAIPRGRWRYAAAAAVVALALFEGALVLNLFPRGSSGAQSGTATLSTRDESSLEKRVGIWASGLAMIRDYPLTGIGMGMYRAATSSLPQYAVPGFAGRIVPHAHNEVIQIGADFGLPGIALLLAFYATAGYMLWQGWRRGKVGMRGLIAGIAGGLLAHAAFGMGDAITLWDRLIFIYWWLMGLAGAQYALILENS